MPSFLNVTWTRMKRSHLTFANALDFAITHFSTHRFRAWLEDTRITHIARDAFLSSEDRNAVLQCTRNRFTLRENYIATSTAEFSHHQYCYHCEWRFQKIATIETCTMATPKSSFLNSSRFVSWIVLAICRFVSRIVDVLVFLAAQRLGKSLQP